MLYNKLRLVFPLMISRVKIHFPVVCQNMCNNFFLLWIPMHLSWSLFQCIVVFSCTFLKTNKNLPHSKIPFLKDLHSQDSSQNYIIDKGIFKIVYRLSIALLFELIDPYFQLWLPIPSYFGKLADIYRLNSHS